MKKILSLFLLTVLTLGSLTLPVMARENEIEDREDDRRINEATFEASSIVNSNGTLIEIGNTTAAQTTIVLRINQKDGSKKDVTVEINEATNIQSETGRSANLSDWIAGDEISLTAQYFANSDTWVAKRIRNLSFHLRNRGLNGWVTALRSDQKQMDITWQNIVYTLDISSAKLVAGKSNPASTTDFKIGDRVRARVIEDNDGKTTTWKAEIVVALRRDKDLFMRVTRWVVPATIISLPASSTPPTTIEVKILPSKFYQEGDVNNLIGQPRANLTVDVTTQTKLTRQYLGTATLAEYSEGDEVRIIGRLDENTGHLVAEVIKNNNLQKLDAVHQLARVTTINLSNNSLQVVTIDGKTWTVMINDRTHITMYRNTLKLDQIKIGDILRIRGIVNLNQSTIAASSIGVITIKGEKIQALPAF